MNEIFEKLKDDMSDNLKMLHQYSEHVRRHILTEKQKFHKISKNEIFLTFQILQYKANEIMQLWFVSHYPP